MNTNIGDQSGTVGGMLSTILASVFGWIDIAQIESTVVLAIIGAVVGFVVNLALNWLKKRFRK